jgi:6-pyruvoyl-tetrahydropterin synthase related domain
MFYSVVIKPSHLRPLGDFVHGTMLESGSITIAGKPGPARMHVWGHAALVIPAATFLVLVPMLFLGNASGHDFEFHMNSWMEVANQWEQGIVYPRWAALAHYGYGEARFLFYPPASWLLGALLGTILPWTWVAGAYIWLALIGAGSSMYLLARRWLSRSDALFAAVLYAVNPYHLVIVYWRSALAELLASTLLPLLLLLLFKAESDGWKIVCPLSLLVAAAWLTNAPSAVMVNYSLALLALTLALLKRKPDILFYGAASVLLGACLAGYYLVPAAYEERWVNIAQVLAPGVRPQDNFLFTVINDADHNRFNLLVSTVAAAELAVLVAGVWMSRKLRYNVPSLWWALVAWGAAASLLLFSFTSFAWLHLPKLRFVQLPWRWLLCINVVFAIIMTMALRKWWSRLLLCVGMLAVIAVGWQRIQPPWWDTGADVLELFDEVQSGAGYEGTDEYVPTEADPYEINHQAGRTTVLDGGHSRVHVQQWAPETRTLSAQTSEPGTLVLKLFNYPAWKVEVNGRTVVAQTKEVTGQMIIPLQRGHNLVKVFFERTKDRMIGQILSLLGVLMLVACTFITRRRPIGTGA